MPVKNIYWDSRSNFYSWNSSSSWSVDFNIQEQTVYASAGLSCVQSSRGGNVFCGVSLYFVMGGNPPIPLIVVPGVTNSGVAPAIFDNNVVIVSYTYGASDSGGDCNFQILGFG